MKKSRFFARIVVAAGFVVGAVASTQVLAQDKPVQIRIAQFLPASHPVHEAMVSWLASVTKESGGSITGSVFPSEQLGKALDHYDMARDGIVDMAQVVPGYQPGRFPVWSVVELPFLLTDAPKASASFNNWYQAKHAGREMRDVHYCTMALQDPGNIHTTKKVVVPEDLKGMKLRPTGAVVGQLFASLGVANVKASPAEVREYIERGVAEGLTFPWGSLYTFGLDRAVKYHLDIPLYSSGFVWVMNKTKYESMSANQKQVIDRHCTGEAGAKIAKAWADFESAGKPKIKASPDHVITVPDAAQLAAWHKTTDVVRKSWGDSVRKNGVDPDVVFKEVSAELTKVGAYGL